MCRTVDDYDDDNSDDDDDDDDDNDKDDIDEGEGENLSPKTWLIPSLHNPCLAQPDSCSWCKLQWQISYATTD